VQLEYEIDEWWKEYFFLRKREF